MKENSLDSRIKEDIKAELLGKGEIPKDIKRNIIKTLDSLPEKREDKKKKMIKILVTAASIVFIFLGALIYNNPVFASEIPLINTIILNTYKFDENAVKANGISITDFSEIDKPIVLEDSGVTIKINSLVYDGDVIYMNYDVIKTDKDVEFKYKEMDNEKVYINNREVFGGGSYFYDYEKDKVSIKREIRMDDIGEKKIDSFNFRIDIKEIFGVKGDWSFNTNLSNEKFKESSVESEVNKLIRLDNSVLEIKNVYQDPINTKIKFYSPKSFGEKEKIIITGKNGKEIKPSSIRDRIGTLSGTKGVINISTKDIIESGGSVTLNVMTSIKKTDNEVIPYELSFHKFYNLKEVALGEKNIVLDQGEFGEVTVEDTKMGEDKVSLVVKCNNENIRYVIRSLARLYDKATDGKSYDNYSNCKVDELGDGRYLIELSLYAINNKMAEGISDKKMKNPSLVFTNLGEIYNYKSQVFTIDFK